MTAIPFPYVCLECFHEECIELVKAWQLLTDHANKQAT